MNIQVVACHRKPERLYFYKGKQFPFFAHDAREYIWATFLFLYLISKLSTWAVC